MTDLATVIALVESNNNTKRLRFETALYADWDTQATLPATRAARTTLAEAIVKIHDCSVTTARMIACTSWGRFQILGENLYGPCRCVNDVFTYITSPALEAAAFDAFLAWRKIDFTLDDLVNDEVKRDAFIAGYNGPGDLVGYWARMQAAMKQQEPVA